MKKLLLGGILAAFTTSMVFAGDVSEPVITEVKEAEAASSAPWLPLLLLVGVGILVASQDDNSRGRIADD